MPSSAMRLPPRHEGLDVIRGFAILAVILHHLALDFRLPLPPTVLGDFLPRKVMGVLGFSGYEGVFVFFVLSGFLITRGILARDGALSSIDWRAFYQRRFARIVPLLLILLAVLSALHLARVPGFVISGDRQSLGGALFSALGLHLNWYEGRTGWLPGAWDVLWSLSIEELFYLVFPVVCLVLPTHIRRVGLVLLVLSLPWTRAALEHSPIWQEKAYLPGMSAIALGVLSGDLVPSPIPGRLIARLLGLAGAVGMVAVLAFTRELRPWLGESLYLVLIVSAAALILATDAMAPTIPRVLRPLAAMGRLSYELYLTHMFVVLAVTAVWQAWAPQATRWQFLAWPLAVAVSFALAALTERWISAPAYRSLLRSLRAAD